MNPGARLERLRSVRSNKDSIHDWVKIDLAFIQIKSHDTIADLGSYDGYYPLMYSLFSDSVVFYLNDITQTGFIYFDSMQTICMDIKEKPLTNTYNVVIGNDSSSELPGHLFSKIILRDALHHFKLKDKMLLDIKRIMNPDTDAKLVLFEPIKGYTNNEILCPGAMSREELLMLLDKSGFILKKELAVKEKGFWFEFGLKKN